jgi:hypothetical protein
MIRYTVCSLGTASLTIHFDGAFIVAQQWNVHLDSAGRAPRGVQTRSPGQQLLAFSNLLW